MCKQQRAAQTLTLHTVSGIRRYERGRIRFSQDILLKQTTSEAVLLLIVASSVVVVIKPVEYYAEYK